MASEHDILSRLPDGPDPAPDARQAAITEAMMRFDQRNRPSSQGFLHDLRLKQQTASSTPPLRRSSARPRARHLIAASLAVLVAGSALGLYVQRELNLPVPAPQIQTANAPTKIVPRAEDRVEQPLPRGPSPMGYAPPSPVDPYSRGRIVEAPRVDQAQGARGE